MLCLYFISMLKRVVSNDLRLSNSFAAENFGLLAQARQHLDAVHSVSSIKYKPCQTFAMAYICWKN